MPFNLLFSFFLFFLLTKKSSRPIRQRKAFCIKPAPLPLGEGVGAIDRAQPLTNAG
jgi:hypothetical protein